ncbi:MAG: hypothetical protein CVV60_02810 [Tenericutes bacterium HGW-Tenericutes-5]|jgi:vacuolar-type H+-ATPase subunit E/Vma4|nr:MAG: hypothetical protein CVV62_01880 [Tenericutes bacterium HGW-Tenericutes-7]PKK95148.1 MAG: hypothetical protein CVV60_02810 [Tenericutes bacterium HGW-Tenericutes-5]
MPYFNNNEDAYRLFSKDIISNADQKIEKLKNEIEENKSKNIARIEAELHSRVFRGLELDLNDLNADFSANLSKVRNEYTRVLMTKRKELLDSIVSEARIKLNDYVKTDEYKKYIKNKVDVISEKFSSKKVEFRVKADDKVAIEGIKKNFNGDFTIKEINEIEIGGFSAVCFDMGFMLDETIDAKLKEKQLWFYEHSDLAAK